MMSLIFHPDPILSTPTKPVTVFDSELENFCKDLTQAMYYFDGAGLAANQVGDNRSIFVISEAVAQTEKPVVFINPSIIACSCEVHLDEACLSLPSRLFRVPRYLNVEVEAYDVDGTRFFGPTNRLYAQAIQHEMDHLNGIVLSDIAEEIPKPKRF